ncbi:endonuclease/exonuclease/phosphatase family protein [Aquicella lusitana]|uniref:Endonuclease/exonuclease/phosphatase family protein n=1 Tax=Aquicella lusitana TaxID=254246 RepID=A0A370G3J8_9COXI|nr:endonuclease/exonuclease/phosphatase family protein [Aquicella lusitana]RDI38447.1 hypothetical protein C8D86_1326 [Aquicella lusitana]VVC73756.1 hypothetical protein AQULUS_15050 [Aquicella lusitana]
MHASNNYILDYNKVNSDHLPQLARLKTPKSTAEVMIFNMMDQCSAKNDPKAPYNNRFGQTENQAQYEARLKSTGENINQKLKSDNELDIILLQEAPSQQAQQDMLMGSINEGLTSPMKANYTGYNGRSLLTLYNPAKYKEVVNAEWSKQLNQIAPKDKSNPHGIQCTILENKNTGEQMLVVNVHARMSQDVQLQQQIQALQDFAKKNNLKLVMGGDFNRDILTQTANPGLTKQHAGPGTYSYPNTQANAPKARDGFLVSDDISMQVSMLPEIFNRAPLAKKFVQQTEAKPSPPPIVPASPTMPASKPISSYSKMLQQLNPENKVSHQPAKLSLSFVNDFNGLSPKNVEESLDKKEIPTLAQNNLTVFDNVFDSSSKVSHTNRLSYTNMMVAHAAKNVMDDHQLKISCEMVENINKGKPSHDGVALKLKFATQKEAENFSKELAEKFGIYSHTFGQGVPKTAQSGAIYLTKEDLALITTQTGLAFTQDAALNAYQFMSEEFRMSKVSTTEQVNPLVKSPK